MWEKLQKVVECLFFFLYASDYLCNTDLAILDFAWLGNK